METNFVESLKVELRDIEPKAENCTEVKVNKKPYHIKVTIHHILRLSPVRFNPQGLETSLVQPIKV